MSGLAAVFGGEATPRLVRRMLEAAPHRGEVRSLFGGEGWAFGTQEQQNAHPFLQTGTCVTGGLNVVVAGCIYRGERIATRTDAAKAICSAFHEGGLRKVEALPGSFSAVVIEPGKAAWGVRSSVGERPLFWRRCSSCLGFASEVKQLVHLPGARASPDEEGLLDLIALQFGQAERTSYKSIRRLPPGTSLAPAGTDQKLARFWDLSGAAGTADIPFPEAVAVFRRLLHTAVARRLVEGSALLLSGGLDSAAIAAEAAPLHRARFGSALSVVSARYPHHKSVDESVFIEAISNRLGVGITWVEPQPKKFSASKEAAWLHDGFDSLPVPNDFRQILSGARDAGFERLLDGHDGDTVMGLSGNVMHELLRRRQFKISGGYSLFRRRRLRMSHGAMFRHICLPALIDFVPSIRKLRSMHTSSARAPAWVTGDLKARLSQIQAPCSGAAEHWSQVSTALGLGFELLEREALSEGVGLVHPFADQDLVSFLVALAPEVKFAGGLPKALIRKGYSTLPQEVTSRTNKTLFNEIALQASPREVILEEVEKAPRLIPGVDWGALKANLQLPGTLPFSERALIARVLLCDRFLECA